jgi:EF-hand domain-containing protein 1
VLRVFAYFEEVLRESAESMRRRGVVLLYHLDDDTMTIHERAQCNSGIPLGFHLKRARYETINLDDLVIGSCLDHPCGLRFHMYAIDGFTRDYFASVGIPQPDDLPAPDFSPPHIPHHDRGPRSLGNTSTINASKESRFLREDRRVCRFKGLLDGSDERRFFTILYFLSDNTVEVSEQFPPNSGRGDTNAVLLVRSEVNNAGIPMTKDPTGYRSVGGPKFDLSNLFVGKSVVLAHHKLFVYDADEFTRSYFRSELGIVLPDKVDIHQSPASSTHSPPPYTGYGTWEDSMGSVKSLHANPATRPRVVGVSDTPLIRMRACLVGDIDDRRFIVVFHPDSGEVGVQEILVPNSGIVAGGTYLKKGVYENELTGKVVDASDIVSGNSVRIFAKTFNLFGEREENKPGRRKSIKELSSGLKRKLIELRAMVHETFRHLTTVYSGKTAVDFHAFDGILKRFGFDLSRDETLELMQVFDGDRDGQISYEEFCDCLDRTADEGEFDSVAYAAKTEHAMDEKLESEMKKHAVMFLSDLFYTRDNFANRLLKELCAVTPDMVANLTSETLKIALENLGFQISPQDAKRCIEFAGEPLSHFSFVKKFSTIYHSIA